jgi:hypothetical protein
MGDRLLQFMPSKDTPEHATYQCPEIRSMWETSKRHLHRLTNEHQKINPDLLQIDLKNIVLCLPEARKIISKRHKQRLQLWHSATLYVITDTRENAIWIAREQATHTRIQWDLESVMKQIGYEIRGVIWKICNKTHRKDGHQNPMEQFERDWCNDGTLCEIRNQHLRFTG